MKKNEKVFYRGNRSWRSYFIWIIFSMLWVFFGLFFPLLFIFGLITLCVIFLKVYFSEYVINTEGVYVKNWSYLDHKVDYLPWKKIKEVSTVRSNMGELLDFGDIKLGPLGGEFLFIKGVKEPDRVVKLIKKKR